MKNSNIVRIFVFLSLYFLAIPLYADQVIPYRSEPILSADEYGQEKRLYIDLPDTIAAKEPRNCKNCEYLLIAACVVILLLLYITILNWQAQKSLRRSEEYFRTIADYTYDWEYWIGEDGKFIYVSPSCERITGYRKDEFIHDDTLLKKVIHPEDRKLLSCLFGVEYEERCISDFRIITKSGEERWINHVCHTVYNTKGERIGRRASNRNITDRKETEEKLRESERRFKAVVEQSPLGIAVVDSSGNLTECNRALEQMLGYHCEELMSFNFAAFTHPDDLPKEWELIRQIWNDETDHYVMEKRYICKDGSLIWVNVVCSVIRDEQDHIEAGLAFVQDITERKQAEYAVRESEKRIRNIFDNVPIGMFQSTPEGKFIYINPAISMMLGYDSPDELIRKVNQTSISAALYEDPDRRPLLVQEVGQNQGNWKIFENRYRCKDGRIIDAILSFCEQAEPLTGQRFLYGFVQDITERKQAEQKLKKRENLFSKVLEILPIGLWIADKNGKLISANPAGIRIWGAAPYVGQEEYRVFKARRLPSGQEIAPDDWALTKTIKQGITISDELLEIDAFDGQKKIILNYTAPVFGDDGSIQGAIVVNRDITERKRAEEMLKESQYRLNLALRSANMGVWEWDILNNQRYFDERSCRILGVNPSTFTGTSDEFFNMVYSDDREMIRTMLKTAVENSVLYDPEYRVVLPDGSIRYIKAIGSLYRDDAGNPARISGIIWDITERRYAEAEKAKLESRLRQAQSMEAIGTLAGGIAHDFNNILFPIIGYTEMTLDAVPRESRAYKNLQEVLKAAMRAKELVGQILTFSRQKEQEKRIFKLHHIVKETLKLLRATIPSTIIVSQNIDPNCDPAEGDPTQIHQIVMNLCTNAYHAMQDKGGEMKVSLTEIELLPEDMTAYPDMMPGVYLKLSVSDTGAGIPENILGKIFDPFFTTKPVGQGTGLGLSVVHGIVKKMGGDIRVYSEVGVGTAFVVYIPAVRSVSSGSDPSAASNVLIPGGTEHILLVDDEEPILDMLGAMLQGLGYRISSRTSSVEALKVFENKSDDFDIVITDMTMPNMTGVQLARKLLAIRPDIPIILCTGFSQHISYEKGKHAGIRGYLMKPVIRSEMAKMIRKVLEEMRNEK